LSEHASTVPRPLRGFAPVVGTDRLFERLGVAPVIVLAAGTGLAVVSVADTLARHDSRWAEPLFWLGMLVLWLPGAAVVLSERATRESRIAALAVVGMGMFVVHVLYSPLYFVGHDEFIHWKTAADIVRSGKIFNENSLLPISPLYPGLEIATSAVVKVTGLSVFVAGTVVVGAARLVLILALYFLYELVGGSARVAGIATLVYFTNPKFLFFDTSYAYESLAISLAVFVLYLVVRGNDARSTSPVRAMALVVVPLIATAVTHHVTSFILSVVLLLFAIVGVAFPHARREFLWVAGLTSAAIVLTWLALVASSVISYLEPNITGGVGEVVSLIGGEHATRHLFQGSGGQRTAIWDQAASFGFAGLTSVALVFGWWRIFRSGIWRASRAPFVGVFVFCSLAYPLSSLFRLTSAGAELADRLSEFVFVPVAFCIAWVIVTNVMTRRIGITFLLGASALLLYGGIAVGYPAWLRLPGPYLVSADERSIGPQGIDAASWSRKVLGPDNRIAADRDNRLLMLTYGAQRPVTPLADRVDISPVYFGKRLTPADTSLLRRGAVHYLVVDKRLSIARPIVGIYVDAGEPGALNHRKPLAPAALAKFDALRGASRLFDSGSIVIYDVSHLPGAG
jgi:hypothetical protein